MLPLTLFSLKHQQWKHSAIRLGMEWMHTVWISYHFVLVLDVLLTVWPLSESLGFTNQGPADDQNPARKSMPTTDQNGLLKLRRKSHFPHAAPSISELFHFSSCEATMLHWFALIGGHAPNFHFSSLLLLIFMRWLCPLPSRSWDENRIGLGHMLIQKIKRACL